MAYTNYEVIIAAGSVLILGESKKLGPEKTLARALRLDK
jgi:hypothetical protein